MWFEGSLWFLGFAGLKPQLPLPITNTWFSKTLTQYSPYQPYYGGCKKFQLQSAP